MLGQKHGRLGFIVDFDSGALCILDLKIGAVRTCGPPSVGPECRLGASGVIGAGGLVAKDARAAVKIRYKRPNPQALNGIGRECNGGQREIVPAAKMSES